MKKYVLLVIILTIGILTQGQTFNFQAGISFSTLDMTVKNPTENSYYDQTLMGYSFLLGWEYLDKKYYNLTSNIGLINKGGKDDFSYINFNGDELGYITLRETLDYFCINTTFDLKYPTKTITPFISIGPRIDFLLRNTALFDELDKITKLNKTAVGLIIGGGIKYEVYKLQFGIRTDYLVELRKICSWTIYNTDISGELATKTSVISLTIGYKF